MEKKIQELILPGTIIPKPKAKADFVVKDWGTRRSEKALIYFIPNHVNTTKPSQKGVTVSEFEKAFSELQKSRKFTREWFNKHLALCAKEGSCNYTTIGGIFELLGEATYSNRGLYTVP
ncbi:MAG: hypothetical protein HY253_14040 [Burkholderiales bacterium]|nr:hypothetical protein [Burkholderiales bacterium]